MPEDRKFPVGAIDIYRLAVRLAQGQRIVRHAEQSWYSAGDVESARHSLARAVSAFAILARALPLGSIESHCDRVLQETAREWGEVARCGEDTWTPYGIASRLGEVEVTIRDFAQSLNPTYGSWFRLGIEIVAVWNSAPQPRDPVWEWHHLEVLDECLTNLSLRIEDVFPPDADYEAHERLHLPEIEGSDGWAHVESGLRRLARLSEKSSGGGGDSSVDRTESDPVECWYHEPSEERPPEFAHGPISGNQKQLAEWCCRSFNMKTDRRNFKKLAERGVIWVRKVSGQRYDVFFREKKPYAEAHARELVKK